MDRPPHDYAAAMAFAQQQQQQQQQAGNLPGQQFPFPPQHQQFPPSVHGPPFLPPHPSVQQYQFPRQQQPQSLHPHLLHHQHQQPGPPFPPHGPPHLGPPFPGSPYDSAPPPVPPPHDPELQKRIDKLVEYVAKNGPEFESMVCEKEHGNPAYSFLFGGEGHGYYRYKLYLFTRMPGPFSAPYPSSMPVHQPPVNAAGVSGSMMGGPQMHQPPFPHFFDQQQPHSQTYMGHGRPEYDRSQNLFRSLSGPLPFDVAMELNNVLNNLSGTKESIKSAKAWFMQRSAFALALAEALRERVFALEDSEKQLHIIYLANDILFDSFQRRVNPHELDNEALAFKPVLGSMLARIYHHPQNKGENQSRLEKIVQFWASKEVFDQETIHALNSEMLAGPPASSFLGTPKEMPGASIGPSGVPPQTGMNNLPQWQQDKQSPFLNQEQPDRHGHPMPAMIQGQQFLPHTVSPIGFPGSIPLNPAVPPINQQHTPNILQQPIPNVGEKLPTYPLFPPGLIPGIVKKRQIGSGVPYSPMSPLDIPTIIPPSHTPESELLDRVSKFFKEIGEVNPSEGPMSGSDGRYEDDYERVSPVRKGGACIPPPPNLQTGSDQEPASFGSGRSGLGATSTLDEGSQYDDVYGSYRKHRSSNYHTSMSVRSATK